MGSGGMTDPWNRDSWGLICKRQNTGNLDGGDSAANEGTYIFCRSLLNIDLYDLGNYANETFNKLEYLPGHWRRHPDTTKWYAQPGMDRWSRDQSIPILCALSQTESWRARIWHENHKRRWFLFMPNNGYPNGVYSNYPRDAKKKWFGDPTLMEYYSILVRSGHLKNKYWMLWFLDFELLIGSYFRKYFSKDRDVRNHVLSLVLSNLIRPTWVSRLARKIIPKEKFIQDVTYWFRDRSHGEPPMHELLVPVIKRFL